MHSSLEKEESPLQESEVLMTGKIPSEAQQPAMKDDLLTGSKAGLSESLLMQIPWLKEGPR